MSEYDDFENVLDEIFESEHALEQDNMCDEIYEAEHALEQDNIWDEIYEAEHSSEPDNVFDDIYEAEHSSEPDNLFDDIYEAEHSSEPDNVFDDIYEAEHSSEPDNLFDDIYEAEHSSEPDNLFDDIYEAEHSSEPDNVFDDIYEAEHSSEPDNLFDDIYEAEHSSEPDNLFDDIYEAEHSSEPDNLLDDIYEAEHSSEPDNVLDDIYEAEHSSEPDNVLDDIYEAEHSSEPDNVLDDIYEAEHSSEPDNVLDDIYEAEHSSELDAVFDLGELGHVLHGIDTESANSALSKEIAKPEFKPKYLSVQNDRDKAINAIIEIITLWDYIVKDAEYNYPKMYSKLSIPISEEVRQECQRHKYAVYEKKTKEWLVNSSDEPEYEEPKYEFCYADGSFQQFKGASSSKGLLLVGKYTSIKQEPNFLERMKDAPALFDNFKLPTIKLVVGAPGCGKTRYIVNNHQPGSLVLTSCSEGAQDVRARMAEKHRSHPLAFKRSYRTIDSYLLNSRDRYSIVWVDEALMEHPGKIFLVCLYSRCDTMYLLGDPNQLGYINRVEEVELLYDKSSTFFSAAETLNTSHRCPVDVMAIFYNKYNGGAYSTSEVMRSMQCRKFTELECVPKSDKIKYLVFKQVEKQQMKVAGYKVSTIHEFQGKEAEDVVVVRMSRDPREELYKSLPHILVAISRHKRSLLYYTPLDDDMKRIIETPLTVEDLKKIKKSLE